uniref:Phorbol-ester/DAG-type domain-containing protein n=1 Tax=Noccaea caerulescens TaxID=107243 RepID=A0A1J3IN05_NOCCA
MRCVVNPPPQSLLNLKAHDHKLTLLPRLVSFTCNACGLKGDRSPYVCIQCDFMVHQDCLGFPRLININRHDHRILRTSLLGLVNSVCGVCHKKVDWTCGGFSCQKCPDYVVHSKCATRNDVWNGKELEGVPEETEDTEPYVIIDANTIQHFSHKEHNLRFNGGDILTKENKWCSACTQPIYPKSFYGCMECHFVLHEKCAKLLKKTRHVLHNERLSLVTSGVDDYFCCNGCDIISNGFRYQGERMNLDVRCVSISGHLTIQASHPQHLLYFISRDGTGICNCCNNSTSKMLKCIEDKCVFVLDFKCATLPQEVKHRVDDHPLTLCYGEKADGKYWCDICEKETNPKTWFYTSQDHRASLHIECVLGDLTGFMPGSTIEYSAYSYEMVLNNSMSRPRCIWCKSHCMCPIILKMLNGTLDACLCSYDCLARSPLGTWYTGE